MSRGLALVACGLIALAGCKKSSTPASFGVPTTGEEIQNKQNALLNQAHPSKILEGEFVYSLRTQHVYINQQPAESLLEEEALTVTEKKGFPGYSEITLIKEIIDHMEDGSPHYQFKDIYYVEDLPPAEEPSAEKLASEVLPFELKEAVEAPQSDVQFYNLIIKKDRIERPKKVSEREPCPEGQECKLNIDSISYDVVVITPGETPQVTHVETWISADVPYFATILKQCIQTIIAIDDLRPLVRQCKSVYDYQYQTR